MFDCITEVIFNRELNKDIFLMALNSPDIAVAAEPGQFVMIRVGSGTEPFLRRPFSICGKEGARIFILYKVVGSGTAIMSEKKDGEEMKVLGPLGRGFRFPQKDEKALLVAGGIGIAPLLFLTQNIKAEEIFVGYGSAGEIIPTDHIPLLSSPHSIATDDGSLGHKGLVTDLLEEYLNKLHSKRDGLTIYSCGPKPMLKKIANLTATHGIPCQVSLEASMACGLGACQGCAVPASGEKRKAYFHVCQDGPVFPAEFIDWEYF